MVTTHSHQNMNNHRRAVGVFPNRHTAEQALYELRDAGFPMDRVSVITRDEVRDHQIAGAEVHDSARDHARRGNKADEGATTGAAAGGAIGGLTGLLVGLGTLAIPGIGPIMLAGATATALATTLAGGAIGAVTGGLIGALIGLGIPEERAKVYNDRVAQGGYLVMVDGTDEQITLAERILHQRGIEEYGVYNIPGTHTTPSTTATATSAVHPASSATVGSTNLGSATTGRGKRAIGFFPSLQDAERAIADLRSAGFPLNQVSLVGRNFGQQHSFTGIDLHDRFDAMRYGIAADRTRYYDDRLAQGNYLVIVSGTEDEVRRAFAVMNRYGIQDWQLYDASMDMAGQSPVVDAPTTVRSGSNPGTYRAEVINDSPEVIIIDHRKNPR